MYRRVIIIIALIINAYYCYISNEDYHPDVCTVKYYSFQFIIENNELKIHGLWAEQCNECLDCGYPTCCNMNKYDNFTMPYDTGFIEKNWIGNLTIHNITTCDTISETVFEHEVKKHGSCIGLYSFEYLDLVEILYYKYYKNIINSCDNDGCVILLDHNFTMLESTV